jgi:hypothetical protein
MMMRISFLLPALFFYAGFSSAFTSLSTAPYAFMSSINQHRLAKCPHLGQYEGGVLTGAYPVMFSEEGAPVRGLVEVRLFGGPGVRSKVYRAEASAAEQGAFFASASWSLDEGGGGLPLLPPPCEENLDLTMVFYGSNNDSPQWLQNADAVRMMVDVTKQQRHTGNKKVFVAEMEEEAVVDSMDTEFSDVPSTTTTLAVELPSETRNSLVPGKPVVLAFKKSASSSKKGPIGYAKTTKMRQNNNNNIRGETHHRRSSSAPAIVFDGITLPEQYSAVDRYVGAAACKAFNILSQGITMGCAVFTSTAVMGARMCMLNDRESSIDNVVFSARQNGDCASSGSTTSGSIDTFRWQTTSPGEMVENWCAPMNGTNEGPCTRGVCAEGMRYGGVPGSVFEIHGIAATMAEILKNGPVGARISVTPDFMNRYRGGVFNRTYDPAEGSGHKVSLVGWGSTDQGVPYWLIQNSWGTWWGENGFGRILRGANVMGIEIEGVDVVKPISSAPTCASAPRCNVWSTTLGNCSCVCRGTFRIGEQCDVCPASTCLNGWEMLDPSCARCTCPYGFSGSQCEFGVDFQTRRWAVCQGSGNIDMQYVFSEDPASYHAPPLGRSVVAFYLPGVTSVFGWSQTAQLCAAGITARCPATGSISIPTTPSVPSVYAVRLMKAVNNNGNVAFYSPLDLERNTYLSELHVLASTDPACQPGNEALLASLGSFRPPITTAIDAETARAAASAARLTVAQPAIDQIKAQWALSDVVPTAPISVLPTGLSPLILDDVLPASPDGYLWAGSLNLYRVCPTAPPQTSGVQKKLTLATHDGMTAWINGLGPNGNAAQWVGSEDSGACTEVRISTGVPAADTYTIAFYNVAKDSNIALSMRFKLKHVIFSPLPWISGSTALVFRFTTTYNYGPNAVPMVSDTLKMVDKNGVVVDTVYTYCNCRTAPIATSIPSPAGVNRAVTMTAPKIAAGAPTRTPYVVQLHRANTAAVVSFANPNVVWSKYLL